MRDAGPSADPGANPENRTPGRLGHEGGPSDGVDVAVTRARDDLHLVVPQRFFSHGQNALGDRHNYASRTRFILDALLYRFEKVS
jgi:hypothetical protein